MKPKRGLLKNSRLYVIIDRHASGGSRPLDLARKLKGAFAAGIIQLRDKRSRKIDCLKEALRLRRALPKSGKIFLVNDYPDVAKLCGADGVHLGQDDMPVRLARKALGRGSIIGKSCHTLKQALAAEAQGADYIGMGPLFATKTKRRKRQRLAPEMVSGVGKRLSVPVFAVGGINPGNVKKLSASGIRRVAVCAAVCAAKNPASAARAIYRGLSA